MSAAENYIMGHVTLSLLFPVTILPVSTRLLAEFITYQTGRWAGL
jgi:hypothetical protein